MQVYGLGWAGLGWARVLLASEASEASASSSSTLGSSSSMLGRGCWGQRPVTGACNAVKAAVDGHGGTQSRPSPAPGDAVQDLVGQAPVQAGVAGRDEGKWCSLLDVLSRGTPRASWRSYARTRTASSVRSARGTNRAALTSRVHRVSPPAPLTATSW